MIDDSHTGHNKLEDEISINDLVLKLKEWMFILKSKWKIVVLSILVGSIIGFVYASFQKPIYTATLSFALEDEKNSSGGLSGALGLASSLGFDLGTSAGGAFSGANLIELMQSRTIVEKALLNPIICNGKTISLAEYYLDFTGIREILSKKTDLENIHYLVSEDRKNYSLQKDSLLGTIFQKLVGPEGKGALTVAQKDKKISIINIEVKTKNEIFSKVLAETLVKEVSEFYILTKSKKARNNVVILQNQTDSIRNELNKAISGVAMASDNTFNLNTAMAVKKIPNSTKQVDVQANTAILTQLVTNLEMAKVTLMKETPLIQIIDKPIFPLKKEKLSRLKMLVLGGFLSGFLTIIFLIIKKNDQSEILN